MKQKTLDEFSSCLPLPVEVDDFVERKLAEIWHTRQKSMKWRKEHFIIKCSGCGGTIAVFTKKQWDKWASGRFRNSRDFRIQFCDKCIREKVPEHYGI